MAEIIYNSVIQGDCLEVMKQIPDEYVDMVLTSPPYDNLRTYNGSLEWGEHIWEPIIKELFRVIKKGGVVVWVVGDATIKGSETGTSFRQALYAMDCGFNLHDTMIWNKGKFSAVGTLKTRYASVYEYMFVFVKGKLTTFNPIKDKPNKKAGAKISGNIRQVGGNMKPVSSIGKIISEFGQRYNIWEQCPQHGYNLHPAPFPEKLAIDHIISWSNKNDIILDPFAGSGTTGIACINTGRNYILIEKEPSYIDIINKRITNHKIQLKAI